MLRPAQCPSPCNAFSCPPISPHTLWRGSSAFARHTGASIVLLYVAEGGGRRSHEGESPAQDLLRHPALEKVLEDLRSVISAHLPSGIPCEPMVRTGLPAQEILRCAEMEGIDLVVMATHGRTGLRHILMGSVAETVVRLSRVPVLTVKPTELRESVIRNEDIENELHLR
jgi:nucleotide-binding universal stress UspA family protein